MSSGRALVTGGAGFLGTHVVARLRRDGWTVRATIHERAPVLGDPAIEWLQADLTRPEDCRRAVEDVDLVVMCAANTSGAAVMVRTPLVHVTPNVVMNTQMLDAAYAAGVGCFAFVSSSAAYPPTDDRPVAEDEMFAGDPYPVYHAVGWMKRYAEVLCETYARRIARPMRTVVVRPSNVYGPHDKFDPGRSHVTAALLRKVVERQCPLEVWGTGADVRDLIYVDDFVEGLVRAIAAGDDFLAVNVASGESHSVRDVLHTLLEVEGWTDADVRFDPSKPSTIPVRRVDTRFAREHLGFAAQVSLREGLRRTIAWYRARQGPARAAENTSVHAVEATDRRG